MKNLDLNNKVPDLFLLSLGYKIQLNEGAYCFNQMRSDKIERSMEGKLIFNYRNI